MARVLVVDDDEDIRAVVVVVLEDAGHEVSTAGNGREALQQLAAAPPDVMVLDLMMPEMHGWELAELLRGHPAFGHVPLVVTSATGEEMPLADRVLRKPYTLEALLAAVEQLAYRGGPHASP